MIAYLCPCGSFGFIDSVYDDLVDPLLSVCGDCGATMAEVQWQQLNNAGDAMVKEFLVWRDAQK